MSFSSRDLDSTNYIWMSTFRTLHRVERALGDSQDETSEAWF